MKGKLKKWIRTAKIGILILILKLKTTTSTYELLLVVMKENSSTYMELETTVMVLNKQRYLIFIVVPASEASVKQQCRNCVKEVRHEKYCNVTGLWKYVFELKRNNKISLIS